MTRNNNSASLNRKSIDPFINTSNCEYMITEENDYKYLHDDTMYASHNMIRNNLEDRILSFNSSRITHTSYSHITTHISDLMSHTLRMNESNISTKIGVSNHTYLMTDSVPSSTHSGRILNNAKDFTTRENTNISRILDNEAHVAQATTQDFVTSNVNLDMLTQSMSSFDMIDSISSYAESNNINNIITESLAMPPYA